MTTRPDRVLFPESGFTTADAVAYYTRVSRYILPHLRNRPISFKRYPGTIRGESFWEKDAPSFTPSWVKRFPVPRRGGESDIDYILVNDVRTLKWIASVGGVELHPFLHRVPKIDEATHIVFDLDPGEGAGLPECCEVALLLRETLQELQLESHAKVSGSKGLQLYVPLGRGVSHDVTQPLARRLAEELAAAYPKLVVAKMTKVLRRNRVFIDWSQNADYKTTIAVYSLRAKRELPYVSMPVTWKEVERAKNLDFTPEQALKRLAKLGDLWSDLSTPRVKLPATAKRSPDNRKRITDDTPRIKAGSQSGRRLFTLATTDTGNELWLDMHGRFKRWLLRPDREGTTSLIAMPAGDFTINREYFEGRVPAQWKDRVTIEDSGAYELIEGSYASHRFDLWFTGKTLTGEWLLEKIAPEDPSHRSWRLAPVKG
ncbi:MAG TPA: non-homologous end-joining DNA ligase [Thermoanaerobaculia bacterium]|jgi:bifunctional non-homologous end joining protein LigD